MSVQGLLFPTFDTVGSGGGRGGGSIAVFSPCRLFRYTLWRRWGSGSRYVQFIGLNPSTADEVINDPTVSRCITYAKDWGYDSMCMTNIFAYRATDPRVMKQQAEPVGSENDSWLLETAENASLIVAAWGLHSTHLARGETVKKMLAGRLSCLKLTKDGHPNHPLYLRSTLLPVPFA